MKRKIRRGIEIALPLLGMGIIFGSVLFGPNSLQLQVLLVLIGVLILEAGVWGLTSGILPNERRYLALREEGDHFMGLIRLLNAAAVASDAGEEDDSRFQETRTKMHTSVERMAELAGQDDLANAQAAEAFLAEAESLVTKAEDEAEDEGEAEEAEAEAEIEAEAEEAEAEEELEEGAEEAEEEAELEEGAEEAEEEAELEEGAEEAEEAEADPEAEDTEPAGRDVN